MTLRPLIDLYQGTPVALDNIDNWRLRAEAAIRQAMSGFEERMGYEPDAQEIRLTADETPGALASR
jgi:hypothetical protein